MSLMNKFKFWKKEDDPGFGPDPFAGQPTDNITQSDDPFTQQGDPFAAPNPAAQQPGQDQFQPQSQQEPFSQGSMPQSDPFSAGQNQPQPFSPQPQYPQPQPMQPEYHQEIKEHNVELILTQLDTIKAMLEGINQRLSNLERNRNDNKW